MAGESTRNNLPSGRADTMTIVIGSTAGDAEVQPREHGATRGPEVRSTYGATVNVLMLDADKLARAGNWVALAALATTTDAPKRDAATKALAANASKEPALRWLLEVSSSEEHWAAVGEFPNGVVLPKDLTTKVKRLAKEAAAQDGSYQAAAMARLMPVVQAAVRNELARTVLAANGPEGVLREAARRCLTGSSEKKDRAALVTDAKSGTAPIRVARLSQLSEPFTQHETREMRDALGIVRDLGFTGDDVAAIGTLASRVGDQWTREWLHQPWTSGAKPILASDAFGTALGGDLLVAMLTEDAPADVITVVVSAANALDWTEDAVVVARACKVASDPPLTAVERFLKNPKADGVRDSVWPIVLENEHRAVVDMVGAALAIGDLTFGANQCAGDDRAPKRLAELAGRFADRGTTGANGAIIPPEGWADEILHVHSDLGDGFLTALPNYLRPLIAIPQSLLDVIYAVPAALSEFNTCGFGDQLTSGADVPEKAVAVLNQPDEHLTDDAVDALLNTVGWDDPSRWEIAIRAMTVNPDFLYDRVVKMVDTLDGPEAGHVPLDILANTVHVAVARGLARQSGDRTATAIPALLKNQDDEVVTAGCEWASGLDLSEDDHDLVRAVITADELRSPRHEELSRLRAGMAAQLIKHSTDQTRQATERIHHLGLAVQADPGAAREAAFKLAGSGDAAVRLAAAGVLASTPGSATDEARVRSLLDSAKTVPLRQKLEEALHRLKSPGVAEAIEGLVTLLGLPAPGLPTADLVRHPADHDRFISCVDDVRANSGGHATAKAFINAGVVLADLLVDFAIVAAADAGARGISPKDAKAIGENAGVRPDTGTLVGRQSLVELFDWFPQCSTLRKRRTAHASPAGSRQPITVKDGDSTYARQLLVDIVGGWIDTMSKYPPPRPAPTS